MAGGSHEKFDKEFNFDMTQNLETWSDFNRLAKWVSILTVLTLVGMYVFLVPHG